MSQDLFDKLVDEGPVDSSKLLRDDEILSEEDKARPKQPETSQVNGVAKKKPCANCTCGLKDMKDESDSATNKTLTTGSCSSCHLGDAFRCASCPYKGMPAFKPGEKVTIDDL